MFVSLWTFCRWSDFSLQFFKSSPTSTWFFSILFFFFCAFSVLLRMAGAFGQIKCRRWNSIWCYVFYGIFQLRALLAHTKTEQYQHPVSTCWASISQYVEVGFVKWNRFRKISKVFCHGYFNTLCALHAVFCLSATYKACLSPLNCILTDFKHSQHTHTHHPRLCQRSSTIHSFCTWWSCVCQRDWNALKMLPGSVCYEWLHMHGHCKIMTRNTRTSTQRINQFTISHLSKMIGIVYCTQRKERENAINNMSLESEAESVRCAGASIILYCFARKTIICNFHLHAKVKPVPT